MDDAILELLSDENEEHIKACEEYIDKTKRAILKPRRRMDDLSPSTARLSIHQSNQPNATVPMGFGTHSVKMFRY